MSVLTASLAKSNEGNGGRWYQSLWFRPWTNDYWSSLNSELLQWWMHIEQGHKLFETALTDFKARLTQMLLRMPLLLRNVNCTVSQDCIQGNKWPLTQQSLSAGAMCQWWMTLDKDVQCCRCYTSSVCSVLLEVMSDPWHNVKSSHCRCFVTTCLWNVKVFYRGDEVDIP